VVAQGGALDVDSESMKAYIDGLIKVSPS